MRYVSLFGNWLLEAVLALKPPKESKRRFVDGCAMRLQRQARIDGELIRKILRTGASATVPLFVVAVLAKEVGCSVERLLFGREQVDFQDPNLFTEIDEQELASANRFATFLEVFEVDFPTVLWDYAFPSHRMGKILEITLTAWVELHSERFGQEPSPRSHR